MIQWTAEIEYRFSTLAELQAATAQIESWIAIHPGSVQTIDVPKMMVKLKYPTQIIPPVV